MNQVLNSKFLIIFFFPFLLGILTVLSFRPFNFTFINFFIFPLLFFLIIFINRKTKNKYRAKPYLKNLFFLGYFFGFGFFLSNTYWISYSLTFDENFKFLIPISIIMIPACLALFYGFCFLLSGRLIKDNLTSILLFVSSLSFFDYIRAKILTGFPWNLWAYTWSWSKEMIQILNPIGLFAFNFITILIFTLPVIFFLKKFNYKFLSAFFITSALITNFVYGSFILNKSENQKSFEEILVKVVSPKFEINYSLSMSELSNRIDKMIKYSEIDKKKNTLFIWPEGVFSGYTLSELSVFSDKFKNNFNTNHILIFGTSTKEIEKEKYYNSFVAVNNKFQKIFQYNKFKLVPFGEFIPFKKFFGFIGLKQVVGTQGEFLKGKKKENFKYMGINILPLICYEVIFPEILQRADPKTNLIINISEDAWFGNSIGPHHHFAKAIFRAVENNNYLVRSANKGFTAIINNKGKIVKLLNPNEKGNIQANIQISNKVYKNKNDLIFFLLLITSILIFLIRDEKK